MIKTHKILKTLLVFILLGLWACTTQPADESILFTVNDQLMIMKPDSSQMHVLPVAACETVSLPAWSADNEQIAYICGRGANTFLVVSKNDIPDYFHFPLPFTYNITASQEIEITGLCNLKQVNALSWSPGGQHIALTCAVQESFHIIEWENGTIKAIEAKDLAWSGLDDIAQQHFIEVADWSPTHEDEIILSVSKQVYLLDLVKSTARKIIDGYAPAWSPDGNKIAFMASETGKLPKLGVIEMANQEVDWIYDPNETPVDFPTTSVLLLDENYCKKPLRITWSPDAQALAVSGSYFTGECPAHQIFRVNLQSKEVTVLAHMLYLPVGQYSYDSPDWSN